MESHHDSDSILGDSWTVADLTRERNIAGFDRSDEAKEFVAAVSDYLTYLEGKGQATPAMEERLKTADAAYAKKKAAKNAPRQFGMR
jgi:hypothetical protein